MNDFSLEAWMDYYQLHQTIKNLIFEKQEKHLGNVFFILPLKAGDVLCNIFFNTLVLLFCTMGAVMNSDNLQFHYF